MDAEELLKTTLNDVWNRAFKAGREAGQLERASACVNDTDNINRCEDVISHLRGDLLEELIAHTPIEKP